MGYTLLDENDQPVKGRYTLLPDDAPVPAKPKPFGQQLNDAIHDAPRQLGLTARYGLEGIGGTFDALVGNPIRTLAAPIFGNKTTADTGGRVADLIGLPKPKNSLERIVGDATRMVAGGAVPLASGASMAKNGTGIAQGVGRALASNPIQQLASAGSAGAAGGYTRETGGDGLSQTVASLVAGVAAPVAINAATRGAQAVTNVVRRGGVPQAITPEQVAKIDITIKNALEDSGIDLTKLPHAVAQDIRNDVAAAFRTSDQVSPDAVRRLADYRITGLTPTAAGLTLDPAIVTQQKNLAKLGVNSKDKTAQFLGQTENRNNQLLKHGLNSLGAGASDDVFAGGERVMNTLSARDARANEIIGKLYDQARDSAGRSAQLDHVTFTNRAGDLLHDANVESFLTPDIRNKLNGFASGDIPLTVEIAEQFKTGIGRLQRNSSDGNVRHALGLVRQALDETPLLSQRPAAPFGGNQLTVPGGVSANVAPDAADLGQDAINAFNKARRMNRSWMQIVERTPALQAVRDGVEPDKFVRDFIVGSGKNASVMSVAQLKNSIKSSPDAMNAVRGQIVGYLKSKALNGMPDETANFGSKAYVDALNSIGERKLRLFFQPEEIEQLKAIGRVARYEQFQPTGSAVGNSNTAAAFGGHLERIMKNIPLASPLVKQYIAEPLQNIQIGMQSSKALDVPRILSVPSSSASKSDQLSRIGFGISPAALLLHPETEEEKQRRLLSPTP